MKKETIYTVVICLGVVAASYTGWRLFAPTAVKPEAKTPAQLESEGMTGDDVSKRATAIEQLGLKGKRANLPALFEAMDDPSPVIRGRAGVAVARIIGKDRNFQAEDPPEVRKKIIDAYKADKVDIDANRPEEAN